jgi:hypothetical protein
MHTMNLTCDVPPDRTVTLKLPESVPPGRHELVVVIDAPVPGPAFRDLSPEERSQRLASVQTRWRQRLSTSDEFARLKEAEIAIEGRREKQDE